MSGECAFSAARAASAAGLLNALPCIAVFVFQPMTGYILDHFRDSGTRLFNAHAYAMACMPFVLFGLAGAACLFPVKDSPETGKAA